MSVSLEMERWNLLVNQLEDIFSLVMFCLEINKSNQTSDDSQDLNGCLESLSNVNVLSKYEHQHGNIIYRSEDLP